MAKTLIIEIPDYRAKSRNQTKGLHFRHYMKARDEIVELMWAYYQKPIKIEPAIVTIEAYFKGKKCIDTSNIDDKLILDGLQHLGVLTDDTPYQNPVVIKMAFPDVGENKVVIRVSKK